MKRFLITLFTALIFAVSLGSVLGAPVGVAAMVASFTIKAPANSFMMAVTPEIWTDFIVENLFKDNEFLLQSVDESQYVVGGTLVHIPQAGSVSKAERNRTSLPATITRRSRCWTRRRKRAWALLRSCTERPMCFSRSAKESPLSSFDRIFSIF